MSARKTATCAWNSRIVGHAEVPPGQLLANPRNFRRHPTEQQAAMKGALDEIGWIQDVIVNKTTGHVIDGHLRVELAPRYQAPTVPVKFVELNEDEERIALATFDPISQLASTDYKMHEDLLRSIEVQSVDLSSFIAGQIDMFRSANAPRGNTNADDVPQVSEKPVTVAGDVWLLGNHRVMCGSSTNPDDVAALMLEGEQAAVIHADPPYGMGKEADGVQNDNLYNDKLDRFQMEWWRAYRPFLASNGSAYIWGNAIDLWRLWFRSDGLNNAEPLTLRNEIVWDKKSIAGMASPDLTMYPIATERCLFFQVGRYVFKVNQTKDDYWPGWDPVRTQLCAEREKAGLTPSQIKKICGNHMYGHWFSTSQWVFISRDNYEKLKNAAQGQAFTKPYDTLEAEYRQLERVFKGEVRDPRWQEFSAARPYFDNAHDIMHDVWDFPRVTGEDRFGHATPKPVAMMERAIKSSSKPGQIVVEPFGGTGTTLMACETTGRCCSTMELAPEYVDVIVDRWQKFTGQNAVLESTEQTFETVAASRSQ